MMNKPLVLGKWLAMLGLGMGLAIWSGGSAMAQCYGPGQQLPADTLSKFTATPSDILKLSNAQLISEVRDLVASSPPTLQLVAALLNSRAHRCGRRGSRSGWRRRRGGSCQSIRRADRLLLFVGDVRGFLDKEHRSGLLHLEFDGYRWRQFQRDDHQQLER
jgi:hypothetical protein